MMRRVSLNSRMLGGHFAPFERELIWEREHAGWVDFVGRSIFRLRKTPFSNHFSKHYYIAPPELEIREGQLVELDVGPLEHYGRYIDKSTLELKSKLDYHFVEGFRRIETPLTNPRLSEKEFRERVTHNWRNAEQDNLDRAVAMQIVSCPTDVYGPGGIGSQSFSVSSHKKPLENLKRTIEKSFPLDFSRDNRVYQFGFIQTVHQAQAVSTRRSSGSAREVSYNFLKVVDPERVLLPIQIPTIIQNAEFKKRRDEFDPEVMEFILSSLMFCPTISDQAISRMESNLRVIKEEIEPESTGMHMPIDRHALTRLAMALCRLEFRKDLDDDAFDKGRRWFFDLYREFFDLRDSVFRPGGAAFATPNTRVSYAYGHLGPNDLNVLRTVFRLSNERGESWVSLKTITDTMKTDKIGRTEVQASLGRLNNVGRLLQRENATMFRPLRLD